MTAAFRSTFASLINAVEQTPHRTFLTRMLALTAITRIAAILAFGNFEHPELYEYGLIARNMIAGHGYAMYFPVLDPGNPNDPGYEFHIAPPPTAFTLPGIVLVYYVTLSIFGDAGFRYIVCYAINFLAAFASVFLLYEVMRRFFSTSIARWSVLIASIYPVFIFAVTVFGGTVIYHAVMLGGFLLIARMLERQNTVSTALAALGCGVWMYFRPEMLMISGLFAIYFFFRFSRKHASVFLTIVILCAMPWTIRNYYAYDAFIPLTTNSWLNFWRGNNPTSNGGSWYPNGEANYYDDDMLQRVRAVPQTTHMEIDISHVYRDAALVYWKNQPLDALQLLVKKYIMFWTYDFGDPRARHPLYIVSYGMLLLTFIAGFLSLWKQKQLPILFLICIGTYSITVSLLHVETRYQTYVSILYIPFAAVALRKAVHRMTQRTQES